VSEKESRRVPIRVRRRKNKLQQKEGLRTNKGKGQEKERKEDTPDREVETLWEKKIKRSTPEGGRGCHREVLEASTKEGRGERNTTRGKVFTRKTPLDEATKQKIPRETFGKNGTQQPTRNTRLEGFIKGREHSKRRGKGRLYVHEPPRVALEPSGRGRGSKGRRLHEQVGAKKWSAHEGGRRG